MTQIMVGSGLTETYVGAVNGCKGVKWLNTGSQLGCRALHRGKHKQARVSKAQGRVTCNIPDHALGGSGCSSDWKNIRVKARTQRRAEGPGLCIRKSWC